MAVFTNRQVVKNVEYKNQFQQENHMSLNSYKLALTKYDMSM